MKNISFKIDKEIRVKKFLAENGFSKRAITDILNDGYLIDGLKVRKNQVLRPNDQLDIAIIDENIDYEPIKGDLDIAYEDNHILVVNKAANLTVNSKGQESLANYLAYYFKAKDIKSKVRLVNRLDMDTSGLLMVAKNPYAFAYYQSQLEKGYFKKYYMALVEGKLDIDKKLINNLAYDPDSKKYNVVDKGKEAITIFKTIAYDRKKDITKVSAEIKTGKTHQIRSQLANLGYPILGDRLYGSSLDLDRFLLHCYKIKFSRFLDNEDVKLILKVNFDKYL